MEPPSDPRLRVPPPANPWDPPGQRSGWEQPTWGRPQWGEPPVWGPPPPRRRRAWPLVVVLAVLALAATVLLVRDNPATAPAPAGDAVAALPAPGATGATTGGQVVEAPDVAARRLLGTRARALLEDDRGAFLASVDRHRTAYYKEQGKLFERMRTAPFRSFEYRLLGGGADLSTPEVRARYAPAEVYLPAVEARYRFRGHDDSPVLSRVYFTFVLTADGWRIGGQGDLEPEVRDDAEIWHFGKLKSLSTDRTLVVHHPADGELARRVLEATERGYRHVADAWSGDWERKVVVLLPHDQDEAEKLVGSKDLKDVAAVATSEVDSGPLRRVLGNRVVVNPRNVRDYDALNLRVVMTHELVHVATRKVGPKVPLLLAEGFADYVAYRSLGLPLSSTRPALAKEVRAGRFGGKLPGDERFRGDTTAVAYDESSSFCLWVADTFGPDKLQSLYQAFGGRDEATAAVVDKRFREVLGVGKGDAEARWASWVRRSL